MSERTELIHGLRDLATWLEDNPEIPISESAPLTLNAFPDFGHEKEQLRAVAKAIGNAEKAKVGSYLFLRRRFGALVTYEFNVSETDVCERIVTGKRVVEKPDPAAPMIEVEEDVVEWRCPPLLAGESVS